MKQCALCASSTHDVHHAIVIGVLVVHCELLVVRVVPLVVCDDAVVRRTLVLIAVAVGFVFVVAIFHRIMLYWRYTVYRLGMLRRLLTFSISFAETEISCACVDDSCIPCCSFLLLTQHVSLCYWS